MQQSNDLVCTVVSFVPMPITEEKPGLYPGKFRLAACLDEAHPAVLHVRRSVYHVYLDDARGKLQVREAPDVVAGAIVEDYIQSQLAVDENARPALFWLMGEVSPEQVRLFHKERVEQALLAQRQWFVNLCRLADDDWARYQRHNAISDFQRIAANKLGLTKDKHAWLDVTLQPEGSRCPACATMVLGDPTICPNCKVVLKPEEFKALQFA